MEVTDWINLAKFGLLVVGAYFLYRFLNRGKELLTKVAKLVGHKIEGAAETVAEKTKVAFKEPVHEVNKITAAIAKTLVLMAISYYAGNWILQATNNFGLSYEIGQGILGLGVI